MSYECMACGFTHETEEEVSECCAITMAGGMNEYIEFTK